MTQCFRLGYPKVSSSILLESNPFCLFLNIWHLIFPKLLNAFRYLRFEEGKSFTCFVRYSLDLRNVLYIPWTLSALLIYVVSPIVSAYSNLHSFQFFLSFSAHSSTPHNPHPSTPSRPSSFIHPHPPFPTLHQPSPPQVPKFPRDEKFHSVNTIHRTQHSSSAPLRS